MKLLLCLCLGLTLITVRAAEPPLETLISILAQPEATPELRLNILRGMNAALKGKSQVPAPAAWPELYTRLQREGSPELRDQLRILSVAFGGASALGELRALVTNAQQPVKARLAALESLISARDADALPVLLACLHEPGPLRRPALRGLGGIDSSTIPSALVAAYPTLNSDERRDAVAALATRPASARALLTAVDGKTIPRTELTAPLVRQLQDLRDEAVTTWLGRNWGAVRTTSANKQEEIARYKTVLTRDSILAADAHHGRAIFAQMCAVCHTIFGAGARIGPELPGAFEDVDYLLQNIVDPNAIIGKDYQQTVVQTKSGQTVIGIVEAQDSTSLTLKSLSGPLSLPRSEVTQLSVLEVSLMPEGLLSALSEQDTRDLFAYLRQHGQVTMLAGPAQANDLFNGTDLIHWFPSDVKSWRMEQGIIEGRASADRPEFLHSDFLVPDFHLHAQVRVTGPGAQGEIRLRGALEDGAFQGTTLRLGAASCGILRHGPTGTAPQEQPLPNAALSDQWVPCEITARGPRVTIQIAQAAPVELTLDPAQTRTHLGFEIRGPGAALQIKDLRLELLVP